MKTADLAQIVTFRLGDDLFAADINSVERVLRYRAPSPVPNVPAWIEGVIEYQGRVLPVIDLRARFGMPRAAQASETRILVFHTAEDFVAVTVDAVLEVAPIEAATLAPPPPLFRGLAGEYLRGVVRRKDRLVIFLDVARLLSTTEQLRLEEAVAGAPQPVVEAVPDEAPPAAVPAAGVAAADAVLPAPAQRRPATGRRRG